MRRRRSPGFSRSPIRSAREDELLHLTVLLPSGKNILLCGDDDFYAAVFCAALRIV
jgi:hypothetical protein